MPHHPTSEPISPDTPDPELAWFEIVARRHTTHEWNGFRYSNASDAIAGAKRAAR